MKPSQRFDWIEEYLKARSLSVAASVDVLDRYFVEDYAEATGVKTSPMPYGADKCKTLGQDLSYMYRIGRLSRSTTGLWNMAGMGFPRWVYTYKLKNWKRP